MVKIKPGDYLNNEVKQQTKLWRQKILQKSMNEEDTGQEPGSELMTSVTNDDHEKLLQIPYVYNFDFDKPGLEKPWQENRDKMEDYFNYGM